MKVIEGIKSWQEINDFQFHKKTSLLLTLIYLMWKNANEHVTSDKYIRMLTGMLYAKDYMYRYKIWPLWQVVIGLLQNIKCYKHMWWLTDTISPQIMKYRWTYSFSRQLIFFKQNMIWKGTIRLNSFLVFLVMGIEFFIIRHYHSLKETSGDYDKVAESK